MSYPKALRNNANTGILEIIWDDDTEQHLENALLRRHCQCAECKSIHVVSGDWITVGAEVKITDIRLIGWYAVQLIFSDGHERGIFPWIYLKNLKS